MLATSILLVAGLSGSTDVPMESCWLTTPAGGMSAKCFEIEVALDAGRDEMLTLHGAVKPAQDTPENPKAIFFLAGGPGQSALEAMPMVAQRLSDLNTDYDFVLLEQRGTGKSAAMDCPMGDITDWVNVTDPDWRALAQECLDGLTSDPRFFLTEHAAMDIEAARQALGYGQISLIGGSYGTRLAQAYAAMYPDHVEKLVLDSIVPNTLALGFEHAINLQAAIDTVFADCLSNPDCKRAFPDALAVLDQLQAALLASPVEVTVSHPRTGELIPMTINRDVLAMVVRMLNYASETQALLPLVLDQAAQGNWQPLAAQALLVSSDLAEQLSRGLELSIVCNEDVPYFSENHAGDDTLMGGILVELSRQQCSVWPKNTPREGHRDALTGDWPVLLLSGERDPVTPPRYGDEVAKTLSNAQHIVVPGQSHIVMTRGCVTDLVVQFFADETLDKECVSAMGAFPFFVSPTGPKP